MHQPMMSPLHPALTDHAAGAVLGLAVGDALGATLEFAKRDSHPHHADVLGGGPFNLHPGQWTDDTAMTLALADSLVLRGYLDPHDLMTRFVRWWREGHYSCTGTCVDVGFTTADALTQFEQTGDPVPRLQDEAEAGNGSLMRVALVALFALTDAALATRLAQEQSRTTHGGPQCLEACVLFVELLREAILGQPHILRARDWTGHPAIRA